jgi:hypothetical protein
MSDLRYVIFRRDKISKTETAEYISASPNGENVFVRDFNGKQFQLKRDQIIKVYDPMPGKEGKKPNAI